MNEFKNPFLDMDFQKIAGEFKMPNMDMESLVAAQKKNIEALTSANQLAVEGMQAVGRRQVEIARQMMEEAQKNAQVLAKNSTPEDNLAAQTEIMKTAIEKAVSNMRELSEMVAKSNSEAFDVVNQRVTASLDELRDVAGTKSGTKSGKR